MKKNNLLLILIFFCTSVLTKVNADTPASWSITFNSTKSFVENKSQFNGKDQRKGSEILFGAEEKGAKIYFTKSGLTYRFDKKEYNAKGEEANASKEEESYKEREQEEHSFKIITDIVRLQWENANPNVKIIASDKTADYYTYPLPASRARNTQSTSGTFTANAYKKIVYQNLYPGIDVEYTFHAEQGIKYILVVHPGADASQVKMKWTGADKISTDENGNIHLTTVFGDIVDHAPLTFYKQEANANPKTQSVIPSRFVRNGKVVSFDLGSYDKSKTIVIDPWTVNPGFNSSGGVWQVETDSSSNTYAFGGELPIQVKKYNSAGTLQWTYTTPWDTSSWIGTLRTDPAGVSYITCGSVAEIEKLNTNGTRAWHANGGAFDEYWSITFNCDFTQLIVGGTRLVGLFSPTGDGKAFNINMNTGAVLNSVTVAKAIPSFIFNDINEIRSLCSSPNGKFYFHTLDTIGELTSAFGINWRLLTSYRYAYTSPSWAYTSQPQNVIRASANYIYTMEGANLYQRNITNGAVITSVAIPGGGFNTVALVQGIQPKNNGLDLDSCGNVYVGSQSQIHKYDASLNLISSVATPSAVYDLSVNNNGEIIACGKGFVVSINMSACPQVKAICFTSTPLTINVTNTNPLCSGVCSGTGTATPLSGTGPYTYAWNNGQSSQIATGLCAGTYSVIVTDASSSTASSSIIVTAPSALSSTPASTAVTCNGAADGSAGVSVSGGTPGYTYSWSNSATAASISNLPGGTYNVTITDSKGCTTTSSSVVTEPAPIVLNFPRVYYICGEAGGTVQLTASGGTSYSWTSGGGTLDDSTVVGPLATPFLPSTTYIVTVFNGACFDTARVTINIVASPPPPIITYSGDSMWVSQNFLHYQWYFEGSPLTGDTLYYLVATQPGHYSVYVTDSLGCKVITQSVLTGILENMHGQGIKIFPNPAKSEFTVYGLQIGSERTRIKIYDAVGQVVYNDQIKGSELTINCDKWNPGVYFVKVEDVSRSFIEKMVIE